MNNIVVIGRLTRDPVYTEAQEDKKQRVNFTVASDNDHGTGASFYDCVAFGKAADIIDKWTHKGKMVAVKGTFEQGEPYTDKDGKTRRSWSLWVERCKFIDSAKKNENTESVSDLPAVNEEDIPDSFKNAEDDIPF